jgi:uncharacterized membrane protein
MSRKPILWATVAAVAVMAGFSVWAAPQLPERVPVQYTLAGEPSRIGSRTAVLIGLPLATLGVGALLWLLPLIFPRRDNLARSIKGYNAVGAGAVALLAILHVAVLLNGVGRQPVTVSRFVLVAVGGLMIVLGVVLPTTRSNWVFGIRLPWTLDSEHSWTKTHQLGGRLFVLFGVVVIAMALIAPPWVTEATLAAGCALLVLVLAAYSYCQWRLDPARRD